ncbi:MAG: hypothetical protein K6F25_04195 [Bacteroidales bacterium]|nr:hypothetical protein [Bacteroidales bacterium]
MNNVFDIKRFWKYLCWDVRNAFNNFGLSLLICALLPAIAFVLTFLGTLVFNPSRFAVTEITMLIGDSTKIVMIFTAILITGIVFPVRQYGSLTDRKAGSTWLMLPASTLEKFLSILLVTCVVVPLCLAVMIYAFDAVMSLVPYYGQRACPLIIDTVRSAMDNLQASDVSVDVNLPYIIYLGFCKFILVYTLGAVFFKKHKIAKTILVLIGLSFVLTALLSVGFFHGLSFNSYDVEAYFASLDVDKLPVYFNIVLNAANVLTFALLNLGIYLRIKTLKH